MRRVVDAMNVIGSRPDGWWRDRPAAIGRLAGELDRWASGVDEAVTLVLEREPAEPLATENVEVIWAARPGPDAADEEILSRLDDWLADDEVTIVTSDRTFAERGLAQGAEVEPASAFLRRMGAGGPPPRGRSPSA